MVPSNGNPEDLQFQREVSRILLRQLQEHGFVLTGSGALREHGLIDRPTADVDVFTEMQSADEFTLVTDRAVDELRKSGYDVEVLRDSKAFKNITVTQEHRSIEVDFGVDYRGHAPAKMDIGPVLSVEDAVASKVTALYGRGLPRDFLDVDAIRQSGRFSDEFLMDAAQQHDPGFDPKYFGVSVQRVQQLVVDEVRDYGVNDDQLKELQLRMSSWGQDLAN